MTTSDCPKVFDMTATWFEKAGWYTHFGIHPVTASLYGNKVEDIINIRCTVIEGVSGINRDRTKDKDQVYWGWFEFDEWYNKDKSVSLIYPCFMLFNMCFPSGAETMEKLNQGICLSFTIERI